jgi:hypothetical protein
VAFEYRAVPWFPCSDVRFHFFVSFSSDAFFLRHKSVLSVAEFSFFFLASPIRILCLLSEWDGALFSSLSPHWPPAIPLAYVARIKLFIASNSADGVSPMVDSAD